MNGGWFTRFPFPMRIRPLAGALCAALFIAPLAAQDAPKKPAEEKPAKAAAGDDDAKDKPQDIDDGYEEVETLMRAIEIVRQNYVDEKKVTYRRLVASALRGMLEDLDPHCQYLSPEVYEQMKLSQENTYEGVGITVAPRNEALVIVSVREDGPAARAGVMPGDQVVKINELLTDKTGYLEAVQMLRGKPGEKLKLTVWRAATSETRELEMVREVMRQESVRDAMLLDPSLTGEEKIGYVRLLQYNAPTATELADALDKLEDAGMKALVLDLRNNPGGLLNSAVEVCGEFLPPGTVVVTTEGRVDSQNPPPYKTPARKRRERNYPMVVLVNNSSASGAELNAGALQDLGRAIIVGETTFGKGSVQSILPDPETGTAIRITTAKYYTPSHKPIHEHGVKPNIVATLTPEEEKRLFDYWRDHSLTSADPLAVAKLGDRQLERAVVALKGVMVYRSLQEKK